MNKKLTLQELELLNTASAYNGEQHKAICGKAALELIEYKKIEEELGIDFITLFKALKQGGVYVKSSFTEDTAIKMRSFQICGDDSGITIWSQIRLNAKDYSKTWALTREELINEKED